MPRGPATIGPDGDPGAELIDDATSETADAIAVRYGADFRSYDSPTDHRYAIDLTPERAILADVR